MNRRVLFFRYVIRHCNFLGTQTEDIAQPLDPLHADIDMLACDDESDEEKTELVNEDPPWSPAKVEEEYKRTADDDGEVLKSRYM